MLRRFMPVVVTLLLCGACDFGSKKKIGLDDASPVVGQPAEAQKSSSVSPEATVGLVDSKKAEVNASLSAANADLRMRYSGAVTVARLGSASFKIPGHIEKTFFRVGDRVNKDQELAVLDTGDYVLRLRLAEVGLNLAKVNLEQAKRDFTREEELKKQSVTTQTSLEKMATALQAAQLGLNKAQIDFETAQKAIRDTRLIAPFSGVISKRLKVEGEHVAAGNPVFEIYESDALEINVKIPENLIKRIKVGIELPVTVTSLSKSLHMRVTKIVPIISETSRTFDVIGKLTRPDDSVVPGMFVETEL